MKLKILMIFTLICFYTTIYAIIVTYQYDNLNRITNIDYGEGYTISYNYDDFGNRTSMTIQGDILIPTFPDNIVINKFGNNTELSWDEVNISVGGQPLEVDYYIIYYSDNPDDGYTILGTTSGTTFTDNENIVKRFYYITAFIGSERELSILIKSRKRITIPNSPIIKKQIEEKGE